MLFARSVAESVIAFRIHRTTKFRRADLQLPYDVAFGLLTTMYLLLVYLQTRQLASTLDMGSADVEDIESDIRTYILNELRIATNNKRVKPPPLQHFIDKAKENLTTLLENGPLSGSSNMPLDKKRKVADNFIKNTLSRMYGDRGKPKPKPVLPPSGSQRNRNTPATNNSTPSSTVGRQGQNTGRNSATPVAQQNSSSRLYDTLLAESNPSIRNANSVLDMRHHGSQGSMQRFVQPYARDGLDASTAGLGHLGPPMPALHEEYYDPPPPPPEQGPQRIFTPSSSNSPSFGARAASANLGGRLAASNSSFSIPRNFSSPLPTTGGGYESQFDLSTNPSSVDQYPFPSRSQSSSQLLQSQYGQSPAELHSSPAAQYREDTELSRRAITPPERPQTIPRHTIPAAESPPPQPARWNFASTAAAPEDWTTRAGGASQPAAERDFSAPGRTTNPSTLTPGPETQQSPTPRRQLIQPVIPPLTYPTARSGRRDRTLPQRMHAPTRQVPTLQQQESPPQNAGYVAYQYQPWQPRQAAAGHDSPLQGGYESGPAPAVAGAQYTRQEYELTDLSREDPDRGGTPTSGWGP